MEPGSGGVDRGGDGGEGQENERTGTSVLGAEAGSGSSESGRNANHATSPGCTIADARAYPDPVSPPQPHHGVFAVDHHVGADKEDGLAYAALCDLAVAEEEKQPHTRALPGKSNRKQGHRVAAIEAARVEGILASRRTGCPLGKDRREPLLQDDSQTAFSGDGDNGDDDDKDSKGTYMAPAKPSSASGSGEGEEQENAETRAAPAASTDNADGHCPLSSAGKGTEILLFKNAIWRVNTAAAPAGLLHDAQWRVSVRCVPPRLLRVAAFAVCLSASIYGASLIADGGGKVIAWSPRPSENQNCIVLDADGEAPAWTEPVQWLLTGSSIMSLVVTLGLVVALAGVRGMCQWTLWFLCRMPMLTALMVTAMLSSFIAGRISSAFTFAASLFLGIQFDFLTMIVLDIIRRRSIPKQQQQQQRKSKQWGHSLAVLIPLNIGGLMLVLGQAVQFIENTSVDTACGGRLFLRPEWRDVFLVVVGSPAMAAFRFRMVILTIRKLRCFQSSVVDLALDGAYVHVEAPDDDLRAMVPHTLRATRAAPIATAPHRILRNNRTNSDAMDDDDDDDDDGGGGGGGGDDGVMNDFHGRKGGRDKVPRRFVEPPEPLSKQGSGWSIVLVLHSGFVETHHVPRHRLDAHVAKLEESGLHVLANRASDTFVRILFVCGGITITVGAILPGIIESVMQLVGWAPEPQFEGNRYTCLELHGVSSETEAVLFLFRRYIASLAAGFCVLAFLPALFFATGSLHGMWIWMRFFFRRAPVLSILFVVLAVSYMVTTEWLEMLFLVVVVALIGIGDGVCMVLLQRMAVSLRPRLLLTIQWAVRLIMALCIAQLALELIEDIVRAASCQLAGTDVRLGPVQQFVKVLVQPALKVFFYLRMCTMLAQKVQYPQFSMVNINSFKAQGYLNVAGDRYMLSTRLRAALRCYHGDMRRLDPPRQHVAL